MRVGLVCVVAGLPWLLGACGSSAQVGSVPANFEPWAVSFVSATRGFVLGTERCDWNPYLARCRVLIASTADAGAVWQRLAAPPVRLAPMSGIPGTVASITFAGQRDGWLSGGGLWETHDGGHHWRRVRLPGVPLQAKLSNVVTGGGWAYTTLSTAHRVMLLRSSIGSNYWQVVRGRLPYDASQPPIEGGLAAAGSSVWLGVGVGGGDGTPPTYGLWQAQGSSPLTYRGNPCSLAGPRSEGILGITASSPTDIVVSCGTKLITSSDGGLRLEPIPDGGGANSTLASPLGRPDTILMAGPANHGIPAPEIPYPSWIARTTDDGRTWAPTYYHDAYSGWSDLQFVGPTIGWDIQGYPGAKVDELMRTDDAGATFTPVRF
ncbi:MAG: hypothetical protein ABSG64_13315 [Solirubrobacteraceae bacterium]